MQPATLGRAGLMARAWCSLPRSSLKSLCPANYLTSQTDSSIQACSIVTESRVLVPSTAATRSSTAEDGMLDRACSGSAASCSLAGLRSHAQVTWTWTQRQPLQDQLLRTSNMAAHGAMAAPGSVWSSMLGLQQLAVRHNSNLSRKRVPKSAGINDTLMPNTTDLKHGMYGIRALTGKRVAANTIEAVRRTLRRRLKKSAALWIRIAATVPVTRKPEGIRMGKGKGAIDFYACPVRPGQIIFEMDRVPRKVALAGLAAIQPKFPCKLGFVEWS